MPLISVVVAVYNVADYLDNCVESLLRQKTQDLRQKRRLLPTRCSMRTGSCRTAR